MFKKIRVTFFEAYLRIREHFIIKKYPFMSINGSKHSWIRAYPRGWHNLVLEMAKEIKEYLITNEIPLKAFRIDDCKEKFGAIVLYFHLDELIFDENSDRYKWHMRDLYGIISHYAKKSYNTCCECGKPATKRSTDYVLPYCDRHYHKKMIEWYGR